MNVYIIRVLKFTLISFGLNSCQPIRPFESVVLFVCVIPLPVSVIFMFTVLQHLLLLLCRSLDFLLEGVWSTEMTWGLKVLKL